MTRLELHSIIAAAQAQCVCEGEGTVYVPNHMGGSLKQDCPYCYALRLLLKTLEKE